MLIGTGEILGGMALAALVVKEAFAFAKTMRTDKKSNTGAGSQSIEFWQKEHRESIDSALRDCVLPILERQTTILDLMRTDNASVHKDIVRILERVSK